jgi:hypothetical protein
MRKKSVTNNTTPQKGDNPESINADRGKSSGMEFKEFIQSMMVVELEDIDTKLDNHLNRESSSVQTDPIRKSSNRKD